jgi:hypothetical protein
LRLDNSANYGPNRDSLAPRSAGRRNESNEPKIIALAGRENSDLLIEADTSEKFPETVVEQETDRKNKSVRTVWCPCGVTLTNAFRMLSDDLGVFP